MSWSCCCPTWVGRRPATPKRWEEPGAECAADKGYDSKENNAGLYDDHNITPVIDKRTLWKDGEKTKPLVADRADHFVYDEGGRVSCVCPATSEQRDLLFVGFERDRGTWKKACNRRSSIERVNSRIDQVFQFEHHTIRGQAKMEARVTLSLIVMLAMALGRIRANQADLMRSLTAPVRRAS